MRILFISKHDPYSDGGGSFATRSYLKAFSTIANGNIDICLANTCRPFHKEEIPFHQLYLVKERSLASRLCSIFTGEMHRYTKFVKDLLKKDSKYDYCVFDQNAVSGTLVKYVNQYQIKTITIHHNYEPEFLLSNEENTIKKYLLYFQVKRIEKIAYKHSFLNFFLTPDDASRFHQVYGKSNGRNEVIGCFEYTNELPQIPTVTTKENQPTFIITGSLSAAETKKAIQDFLNELYPLLPASAQIIIAGKEPTRETIELCKKYPNVELIGNPIDMQPIIAKADIYLCPNRTGGGLKLRIMDGLRNGLPVISDKMAARGYEIMCNTDAMHAYTSAKEFQECVTTTLANNTSKAQVQLLYQNYFSFSAGVDRLKNFLTI